MPHLSAPARWCLADWEQLRSALEPGPSMTVAPPSRICVREAGALAGALRGRLDGLSKRL
jgi:hypothetical protein